jgi:mono/diheme cytochrome c family protein
VSAYARKGLRALGLPRLPKLGRLYILALLVALVGAVGAGCANGTYPLDFFYEMHYQQSYASHEPPRLWAPEGAVPVTGREVLPTENPIPGRRVEEGSSLFAANCAFCHGQDGKGSGYVLQIMKDEYGYGTDARPYTITPDLTADFVKDQPDVAVFGWITNGVTVMPSFDKLLTMEERWLLVNYIRTLSD